jgi:hypothetical protein
MCAVTVSACGSGTGGRRDAASTPLPSSAANNRIERCVDRLLRGKKPANAVERTLVRRYVHDTYCARFEQNGWVYEDGALSIAAQTWL